MTTNSEFEAYTALLEYLIQQVPTMDVWALIGVQTLVARLNDVTSAHCARLQSHAS